MALQKKPPVVTILGHVDHGKTTLLDFIRKTKLAAKEFGEITQSTCAYQIKIGEEKITFIDTPGHEAFSLMRSRGVNAADLVVLVVAANDGVMPQTKEAIKIIKQADVPFLVAINKIDLPEASIDKVKTQLAENEVFVEGYGGNIVAVPVSAKSGEGIDRLLEMILLSTELSELKADPETELQAVVIEAKADKFSGVVVNIVVRNGTLKPGDTIFSGEIPTKVKLLRNELGKPIEIVYPGDPVQILGFSTLPMVGGLITGKAAKQEKVGDKTSENTLPPPEAKLKIILKADVSGSLEAISGSLPSEVMVIDSKVGEITKSDILMAKTFDAEIYAFNLTINSDIKKLADTEKVKIKSYRIIYDLLKELEEKILKIMEPNLDRKILGKAEILAVFEMKEGRVAGAKVIEGKINKKDPVMFKRNDDVLGEAKVFSLKQQKQDVNEIDQGTEFGAIFSKKVDFKVGDVIISYNLENQ